MMCELHYVEVCDKQNLHRRIDFSIVSRHKAHASATRITPTCRDKRGRINYLSFFLLTAGAQMVRLGRDGGKRYSRAEL